MRISFRVKESLTFLQFWGMEVVAVLPLSHAILFPETIIEIFLTIPIIKQSQRHIQNG